LSGAPLLQVDGTRCNPNEETSFPQRFSATKDAALKIQSRIASN
jgi:hypothetical protein